MKDMPAVNSVISWADARVYARVAVAKYALVMGYQGRDNRVNSFLDGSLIGW